MAAMRAESTATCQGCKKRSSPIWKHREKKKTAKWENTREVTTNNNRNGSQRTLKSDARAWTQLGKKKLAFALVFRHHLPPADNNNFMSRKPWQQPAWPSCLFSVPWKQFLVVVYVVVVFFCQIGEFDWCSRKSYALCALCLFECFL